MPCPMVRENGGRNRGRWPWIGFDFLRGGGSASGQQFDYFTIYVCLMSKPTNVTLFGTTALPPHLPQANTVGMYETELPA
jgi:hypothetical protein